MFNWNKKEAPLKALAGMGGGVGRGVAGLDPLEITGASVNPYTNATHSWAVIVTSNPITVNRKFVADDEVEMLLVGGGGGGGNQNWGATGGGGGGGVVFVPSTKGPEIVTGPGTYSIGIGGGGGLGSAGGSTGISGVAIPLTALGGGAGGPNGGPGGPGASGGGGQFNVPGGDATQPTANPGVTGINQYGTPGRSGGNNPLRGGGGGGAGEGGPTIHHTGYTGGNGVSIPPLSPGFLDNNWPTPIRNNLGGYTPSSNHFIYFGAGGGGGARDSAGPYEGGLGGGGAGGKDPGGPNADAGVAGRGAGGGGGAETSAQRPSGPGGKGCVIIRWRHTT